MCESGVDGLSRGLGVYGSRGRGEGLDERDEGARAESRVFTQQSSYLDDG